MLGGQMHSTILWLRLMVVFTAAATLIYAAYFYGHDYIRHQIFKSPSHAAPSHTPQPPRPSYPPSIVIDWSLSEHQRHPIDHLIKDGESTFNTLVAKETFDLHAAAEAYRKRRGRHPPPGFDAWYKFAWDHNAIIVEEFWDQIYHDVEPLWALPPKQLRSDVRGVESKTIIRVRGGAVKISDDADHHFWMPDWQDHIGSISKYLPDMDIAMNVMDEPRLTVPSEDMDAYIKKALEERRMLAKEDVIEEYPKMNWDLEMDVTPEHEFNWTYTVPHFPAARLACPLDSRARNAEIQNDFSGAPFFDWNNTVDHSYEGYVSNYSLSTSLCHQPDMQGLHGAFIEPVSARTSTRLFPIFGGSKLRTNNELLIPAAMYWSDNPIFFMEKDKIQWEKKKDKLIWRGVASGGRHKVDNWRAFHRHRLVAMLNATQVVRMERGQETPRNWVLRQSTSTSTIGGETHNSTGLGEWLENLTDVGFVNLECFPVEKPDFCPHLNPYFHTVPKVPLKDQFQYKYLVDVDGNSYSGRYRSFMQSGSLPIKATMFNEWLDARLVPWKHLVPFDNRYGDLLGIMEYFVGRPTVGQNGTIHPDKGHDRMAQKIATDGKEWAAKVLRREDMSIYTLRILLEYARVVNDQREKLGYVVDLKVSAAA